MTQYIRVEKGAMPKEPKWEWNSRGVTEMLKTNPAVLKMVIDTTQELVDAIKEDIESMNTISSTNPTKSWLDVSASASYFANNVRGQVVRSSKRQKGIPLGMVAMKADNALAYEAEHGNIQRVVQEFNNAK